MTPDQKKAYKAAQEKEAKKPSPFSVYRINTEILPENSAENISSDIQIQNDKVKVFLLPRGGYPCAAGLLPYADRTKRQRVPLPAGHGTCVG